MTLSALLCLHSRKKKREKSVAFPNTVYSYRLIAHSKKGLQWTTAYSCVVVFYLFVNFDFGTSLFFHQENGTQYIYSCRIIHGHLSFSGVRVGVSNAMVLLRFLLNTATSSRFHTVNKLFLKNGFFSLCVFIHLPLLTRWRAAEAIFIFVSPGLNF